MDGCVVLSLRNSQILANLTIYVTDNKMDRDFPSSKPLHKLVTDITYLYFGNCKLYLFSIMDLFNREIIAYSISDAQNTDFVLDTLN